MVKIHKDVAGTVYVGGVALVAGDEIPAGAVVGGHLTSTGKDVGTPESPFVAPIADDVEPLTVDETARATDLGIPIGVHPERVRGALEGYDEGEIVGYQARQAELIEAARVEHEAAHDEALVIASELAAVDSPKPSKPGKA